MRSHWAGFIVLFGWVLLSASCTQKVVVLETGNSQDPGPSNVEKLGDSKSIPAELIQQYLVTSIDTIKAGNYIHDVHFKKELFKELKQFYRFNHYKLAWSALNAPNSDAKLLLNELSLSEEHGLFPSDYKVAELVDRVNEVYDHSSEVEIVEVIHLDILLSAAYLTYAWHLYHGQVNTRDLGEYWHAHKKRIELSTYLAGKSFKEGIEMVAPSSQAYANLRKKLATYLSIADEGGWPLVPDTLNLYPGEYHEMVYLLQERLSYSNDYKKSLGPGQSSSTYDAPLQEAVKFFQKRHGITPDGILNKETITALNVPIEKRIDQVMINLERMRWMPQTLGGKYLMVNIPDFTLKLYKKEKELETMKVIVGKKANPTPVLNDQVEYITFSPTWSVSDNMFNRNVLPKVKKDPEYLNKLGYRLYARSDVQGENPLDIRTIQWKNIEIINHDFRVVHHPGPNDKMRGQVKFAMPNSENLFLCDGSTSSLFDFSFRAFNYSSISVEKPGLLAKYLLDDRKWDIRRIKESMSYAAPTSVMLKQKIPVYITYLTAWVDNEGVIQFRQDVYDYDTKQAELMRLEEHSWLED